MLLTVLDSSQVFTLVIFYTVAYNVALALFFTTLNQLLLSSFTTMLSLYTIPQYTNLRSAIIISFFSMAGIPPFLGFFTKLSIFILVTNLYLFILFPFFFLLLFSGLYFYIQNIRLILTTPNRLVFGASHPRDLITRRPTSLILISYVLTAFLVLGLFYLEDTLLYSSWLLA